MGTLKGRVGDSVFYVKNGEQNVVKKQTHVSNPQTNKQMYQRSRFLACSKFFTRGNKNYFKFAFENKRKGESDFNAFMRENIVNSPNITRDAYQFSNYPIIGEFIMTRGSLPSIEQTATGNIWRAIFPVKYTGDIAPTISSLSSALISSGAYQIGDIITLLFITSNSSTGVPSLHPQLYPSSYGTPVWTIKQFKINPSDYTELSTLGLHLAQAVDGNISIIGDEGTDFFPEDQFSAWCCVHSRITKHGLKVSTSKLVINQLAVMANEDQFNDGYIDAVIADWKNPGSVPVDNGVILEGSLASSTTPIANVTLSEAEGSVFRLIGNVFSASNSINEGSSGIVGYIDGTGIEEERFVAIQEEGDSDSVIQFDQINENRVSIAYNAHGDSGTVNTFRIAMLIGGQPIPIAKVTWAMAGPASLVPEMGTFNSSTGYAVTQPYSLNFGVQPQYGQNRQFKAGIMNFNTGVMSDSPSTWWDDFLTRCKLVMRQGDIRFEYTDFEIAQNFSMLTAEEYGGTFDDSKQLGLVLRASQGSAHWDFSEPIEYHLSLLTGEEIFTFYIIGSV